MRPPHSAIEPAPGESAGVGGNAVDDVDPADWQRGSVVMFTSFGVGRDRLLAPLAQAAGSRLASRRGNRNPRRGIEPGAGPRQAIPGAHMRIGKIAANKIECSVVRDCSHFWLLYYQGLGLSGPDKYYEDATRCATR